MMELFQHEYLMCLYGVALWELEQYFVSKKSLKNFIKESKILTSALLCALVVMFDDELLARFNEWALVDIQEIPLYCYLISGFFIDVVRMKYFK